MATKAKLPKLIFRTGVDFCIGLVVFGAFALAMNSGTGSASPSQFNDLLSISANAAELTTAPDNSKAVAEAAQMVKSVVPVPLSSADSVFRNTTGPSAMWMLGLVFAMLFAFNLAFFRHLRMQYARVDKGSGFRAGNRNGRASVGRPSGR